MRAVTFPNQTTCLSYEEWERATEASLDERDVWWGDSSLRQALYANYVLKCRDELDAV